MKKKGFTLIEILVVATIIGLLAAAGAVTYSQFNKSSRDAKRKADLEEVRAALEMYRSAHNVYPIAVSVLTNQSEKYLESEPIDPKSGNQYSYVKIPAGCDNVTTNCTSYSYSTALEGQQVTYTVTPYGSSTTSGSKDTPTPTPTPGGSSGPPGGGSVGN